MGKARAERADPLKALEAATTRRQEEITEAARTAGLDDSTINSVYRQGEQRQSGAGYRAIESATDARVEQRSKVENLARAVGVDVDAVLAAGSTRKVDSLTALKLATTKRQDEIRAAAHDNGIDDDAISHIQREAERKSRGSGWSAVVQATADESRVREVIEWIREESGFSPSAASLRTLGRSLREEYEESKGAGRLAARLETLPDGCYSLSWDEQEARIISERLDRENIAKQELGDQAALKRYRKKKAEHENKSSWQRLRQAAPEKPQPGPVPPPPSDDQIKGYRRELIARIREFVVNLIVKMFDFWDRLPPPSVPDGPDRPAPLQAPRDQPQHDRSRGQVR